MVKMIVLYAGILAALIAVPRWARPLPDARRGRSVVGLAVSSAILGWAATGGQLRLQRSTAASLPGAVRFR